MYIYTVYVEGLWWLSLSLGVAQVSPLPSVRHYYSKRNFHGDEGFSVLYQGRIVATPLPDRVSSNSSSTATIRQLFSPNKASQQ
jgi:hypothetical protein